MSPEVQFATWFASKANLSRNRIFHKRGHNRSHVRIMSDAGINNKQELLKIFENLNLSYEPCDSYTGSPHYNGKGFNVKWSNYTIGVLLAVKEENNVRRKQLSPHNLQLSGKEFTNHTDFKNAIIKGLSSAVAETPIIECLTSMLDNLENKTSIIDNSDFLTVNGNIVTSDFGEVLSAYESSLRGNVIKFPKGSNNPLADFLENDTIVSCKGRNSGGSVNLSNFRNYIDTSTTMGKFLFAIANHNREDMFAMASQISKDIEHLKNIVGGTTIKSVENFVLNTSYDKFYDMIADSSVYKGLGIPKKESARNNWERGDTNPFYFTLNTIICRLCSEEDIKEISNVVTKFLKSAKFVFVDIVNGDITIKEENFDDIKLWKIHYWGNAASAFNNWIGVQPYRGSL